MSRLALILFLLVLFGIVGRLDADMTEALAMETIPLVIAGD